MSFIVLVYFHKCLKFSIKNGEGNGNPLQYSCPENPRDREAWWATVRVVTKSWTRLKLLSMDPCICLVAIIIIKLLATSSREHTCRQFIYLNF